MRVAVLIVAQTWHTAASGSMSPEEAAYYEGVFLFFFLDVTDVVYKSKS